MQAQPTAERSGAEAQPATSVLTKARPTGVFVLHFLEMCVVMCLGGQLLTRAFFGGAAWIGYPSLAQQAPTLSILAITAILTLVMVVWMPIRRHPWRHNLEMALPTAAIGLLVSSAYGLGLLSLSGVNSWGPLFGLVCGPACAAMLVVMLVRFDMYSGRARHREHAH